MVWLMSDLRSVPPSCGSTKAWNTRRQLTSTCASLAKCANQGGDTSLASLMPVKNVKSMICSNSMMSWQFATNQSGTSLQSDSCKSRMCSSGGLQQVNGQGRSSMVLDGLKGSRPSFALARQPHVCTQKRPQHVCATSSEYSAPALPAEKQNVCITS